MRVNFYFIISNFETNYFSRSQEQGDLTGGHFGVGVCVHPSVDTDKNFPMLKISPDF